MAKTKRASAAGGSGTADLNARGERNPGAGQPAADDLADEQKFAGVTAGLIVRNDPAWASVLATPLETLAAGAPRRSAPTDILARKGEALPSPITGPNAPRASETQDGALIAELERLQEEMLAAERYFEECEATLASAESQCQASEAARIAAAAAQDSLEQALAETRAAAAIRDETHAAELRRMRDRIAALESELEGRERSSADALRAANAAHEAARRERDESHAAELGRLRGQLFALESKLAEREATFAESQTRMKAAEAERLAALEAEWTEKLAQSVAQSQGDADRKAYEQALTEAEKSWQAQEAVRAAQREAQIRQEYETTLAEAEARQKEAEAEWVRVRRSMEAARDRDGAEAAQLHAELAALRTTCLDQKQEIAKLRAELDAQDVERTHTRIVLQPDHYGRAAPRHAPPPGRKSPKRRIIIEALAVAALASSAILFYPGSRNGNPVATGADPQTASHTAAPERNVLLVDHGGNLRAAASGSAAIVGTLSHGMHVEVLEEQGSWTHVRTVGGGSQPLEGWYFGRFLVTGDQAGGRAPAQSPPPASP